MTISIILKRKDNLDSRIFRLETSFFVEKKILIFRNFREATARGPGGVRVLAFEVVRLENIRDFGSTIGNV